MKKKLAAVVLLLLTVSLTSCTGTSAFSQYKKAAVNTANIKKASVGSEFNIKLDMAKSKLTEKMKKQLEAHDTIKIISTASFDSKEDVFKLAGRLDMKNINYTYELRENKEKTAVLFPLFSKYLLIDRDKNSKSFASLYLKSRKESTDILNKSLTEKDIKKQGLKVAYLPEGGLMTDSYALTTTPDAVKQRYKTQIEKILNSIELRDMVSGVAANAKVDGINKSSAQAFLNIFVEKLGQYIDKAQISDPSYSAAIDKDSIIRQTNEAFNINLKIDDQNSIYASFSCTQRFWNTGGDSNISMPQANTENSFTIEKTSENIPGFYRNLMKNIKE